MMLGRGAIKLRCGVEDFEGEDGEAVDDEARGFGVEGRGGNFRDESEEGEVDLLDEVIAGLVEAVDIVLGLGDGVVGGVGIAGVVFAMPEVVVGAVLVEDELSKRR